MSNSLWSLHMLSLSELHINNSHLGLLKGQGPGVMVRECAVV